MAKSKYNAETFPLLAEGFARRGMTDKEIAKALGISRKGFYTYLNLYPEFAAALKRGKTPVDIQVENALLKRALGYEYEEVKTEYVENNSDGPNDGKVKEQMGKTKRVTKIKKTVIPETVACIFWLKNRRPDLWRDKQVIEQTVTDKTAVATTRAVFDSMTVEEKKRWLKEHQAAQ